jgi:alkanesulfonate monooxygenase SsuD/methylene tetrahydromethanopterin reductase-like flavin-dependent oxidoreductase (luciferase family)
MFANTGPFIQPEGLTLLAQTAEEVGVESLWAVEHVVVPPGFTPDALRQGLEKLGNELISKS